MLSKQSSLEEAVGCFSAGLFTQARERLRRVAGSQDPEYRVLLGECLFLLGEATEGVNLLSSLDTVDSPSIRARALEIMASDALERSQYRLAKKLATDSVALAVQSGDHRQVCRSQQVLFSITLDSEGTQACESLASDTRRSAIRSGDVRVIGQLHARFATYEARRGNPTRALRHVEAGLSQLKIRPNPFIEGLLWVTKCCSQAVDGDIALAEASARKALATARTSGHAKTRLAALSNLCFLGAYSGNLASARAVLREAESLTKRGDRAWFSLKNSHAQLAICEGALDECEHVVRSVDVEFIKAGLSERAWPFAEFLVTRARLLGRRGDPVGALNLLERVSAVMAARGDRPWCFECALQRVVTLCTLGRTGEAEAAMDEAVDLVEYGDIARHADLFWAQGHLAYASGDPARAAAEFSRAERVWKDLGGRCPARELPATFSQPERDALRVSSRPEDAAFMVRLGRRPALLANETATLLEGHGVLARVRLATGRAGSRRIVFERGGDHPIAEPVFERKIAVGMHPGHEMQLQVRAHVPVGAKLLVASILAISEAAVSLARLQGDEKYRTSLWPIEEGLLLEHNVFVAPRMRELQASAKRIGPTTLPVLITGETGSGKEVLAREVHDASPRANKSFAAFVCSAVPREMLDSHLFGHRRGAFTGAIDHFPGVIRANDGGTLFLDEIGEISPDLQVKLLRFLETGEIHPLGETRPLKVDVRVIAATNQPLEALLAQGRFREDLYYRLNVVRLTIPPLRDRREEILPLFERFLMRECTTHGKPVPTLSDATVEHLLLYSWPGNVRQLFNEVRRIAATIPTGIDLTPDLLANEIVEERRAAIAAAVASTPNQMLVRTDQSLQAALDEVEKAMLKQALASSPDLETAASKLDITRKGLFLKRQRHGLD